METKNNIFQLAKKEVEYDVVSFKLSNPTSADVNVDLFDVNGAEIPNTATDADGHTHFYITGDTDYNMFVRDTFSNPKKLQRIKL
ncbi:hypothetical protein COY27_01090, partial [Candidatus Woesearchaeota archaeon CG_4_10_14_0_2_um_filter_33_13]